MGELDAVSAALAACRWGISLSVVLLIGSAGAHAVLRRVRSSAVDRIRPLFLKSLARLTLLAAGAGVLTLGLLLVVQVYAWFGSEAIRDTSLIGVMLTETQWGSGWQSAMTGAVVAALGALIGSALPRGRPAAIGAAALAAALGVPLVGHGGSHGTIIWFAHAGHLAGAGLWIGTLAMLAFVTSALWHDDVPVPGAIGAVLRAFSPLALTGAALLAVTGLVLSTEHVRPMAAWWETAYGRTLTLKLVLVAAVVALGWRNWRRLVPASDDPAMRARLRRAVRIELGLSLIAILALTGWLSGLPVPGG